MRKSRIAVFASLFLVSAVVACVGGPGPLPGANDENPDVEKSGTGGSNKSGTSSGTSSGQGSSGTTTSTPPGTATLPPTAKPPSNNNTISGSEFSRACDVDTDCVLVFQGSVCTRCQCPSTAIATSDKANYDKALSDRRSNPACPPQPDLPCSPCSTTFVAVCSASKQCSTGLPKKDGG